MASGYADKVRAATNARWETAAPIVYDGKNFVAWRHSVEKNFVTRRAKWLLSERLNGDEEVNEIAMSVLHDSLATQFKHLLRTQTSFPTAYKAICEHAKAQMSTHVEALRRELAVIRQNDDSVTTFIDRATTKHEDFIRAGGTQSETELLSAIVAGLSPKYLAVKQQHSISAFTSVLSLITTLLSVESVLPNDAAMANHAQDSSDRRGHRGGGGRGRGRHAGHRGGRGHGRGGSRSPSDNQGRGRHGGRTNRSSHHTPHCHVCGCTGHWGATCPDRAAPRDQHRPPRTDQPDANNAESTLGDWLGFSCDEISQTKVGDTHVSEPDAMHALSAHASHDDDLAIYDSGCSVHLTPYRRLLHDFHELQPGDFVQYGGNERTPILGIGTLVLKCVVNGHELKHRIQNVRLVKTGRRTLLSARMLLRQTGFKLEATQAWAHLSLDGAVQVPLDYLIRDLFVIQGKLVPAADRMHSAFQAAASDASFLWHERLVHPCDSTLRALQRRNLVPSSAQGPRHVGECEACALGKGKRTPRAARVPSVAKQPGQSLHADLCFPQGISSHCLLTVVDEASRYAFVFPLQSKSDAAARLQQLLMQLERSSKYVQILQTDRGGEFSSSEFAAWLCHRGIVHRFTPAAAPMSNGMIERFHGTLMPRLRAVFQARNIPKYAWKDTVQGVVYVLNRTPHTGIDRIPFEVFYGQKLHSLAHLRPLGCVCYYTLPGQHSKLAPRKSSAILLGYASDGRASTAVYRVLDTASRRIVESADVVFDERPARTEPVAPMPDTSPLHNSVSVLPFAPVIPIPNAGESDSTAERHMQQPADEQPAAPQQLADEQPAAPQQPAEEQPVVPQQPADEQPAAQQQLADEPAAAHPESGTRPPPRTSSRGNRGVPPQRYEPGYLAFAATSSTDVLSPPTNLKEALTRPQEAAHWRAACYEELQSLGSKGVYTLVELPANVRPIPSMWVFAYKVRADNTIERFKSRLVAKGFVQKPGVDFKEVWAPTGSMATLRCLLAYAAAYDYDLEQADIKTAFLNGPLDDTIYLHQPPGYSDGTNRCWKLHKALYGLKQSARAWYLQLRNFLATIGFRPMHADPAVFTKSSQPPVFLFTHVDDLLLFTQPNSKSVMPDILAKFEGKSFGEPTKFLGMSISRNRVDRTISIGQESLIKGLVRRASCDGRRGSRSPLPPGKGLSPGTLLPPLRDDDAALFPSIVGSVMYIATVSRPDVAFAASSLARFLSKPTQELLDAAKHVVCYLMSTSNIKLVFGARRNTTLQGTYGLGALGKGFHAIAYGDADFANCEETRRSITGTVIILDGTPVVWGSRKQPHVAKSTTAAEYIAASMTVDEAVLIRKVLVDMRVHQEEVPLMCDNRAAECLLKNPIENGKTKYLEIHWHYCRELVRAGKIRVCRVDTDQQLADVLTKSHGPQLMQKFRELLCLT